MHYFYYCKQNDRIFNVSSHCYVCHTNCPYHQMPSILSSRNVFTLFETSTTTVHGDGPRSPYEVPYIDMTLLTADKLLELNTLLTGWRR